MIDITDWPEYPTNLRPYPTLIALWDGQVVEVEGLKFKKCGTWKDLQPGDAYVAERNGPAKLLTVRRVDIDKICCVFPVTMDYPYDLVECVKVELIED